MALHRYNARFSVAKIVLVCLRDAAAEPAIQTRRRMYAFLASLCPDNLQPNPGTKEKDKKVRVFELAKDLNVASKDLIAIAQELGPRLP